MPDTQVGNEPGSLLIISLFCSFSFGEGSRRSSTCGLGFGGGGQLKEGEGEKKYPAALEKKRPLAAEAAEPAPSPCPKMIKKGPERLTLLVFQRKYTENPPVDVDVRTHDLSHTEALSSFPPLIVM